MKLNRSHAWIALCFVCAPFLAGADGGCSGGQVAIGGDTPDASSSAGTAGSAGTPGHAGGPGNAGTHAGGGSGGTGNTQCSDEERALRDFIAANKSCSTDADCQTLYAGCGVTEDGCTGAVYVNQLTEGPGFAAVNSAYQQCVNGEPSCAVCDRVSLSPACIAGSCQRSGVPGVCDLPFEAGSCLAYMPVFAHVDGACVEQIYGGCEGNDNRFRTIEECMAVCEQRPGPNPCPSGRVEQEICLDCGPAGGCGKTAEVCAQSCSTQEECAEIGPLCGCYEAVSQVVGCD